MKDGERSTGKHRLLERRTVFEGKVVRVYVDTVELPDGRRAERELVRHRGAVGMVALDGEGRVFLVKQYRHPAGRELVEIPAGKLQEGEDPLDCARRELVEEIGCRAAVWKKLACFYTSPGFSDEVLHLYLARDLTVGEASPEEDEFLEVFRLPLGQALREVATGGIRDSKTIIGIALTALYLKGEYEPQS